MLRIGVYERGEITRTPALCRSHCSAIRRCARELDEKGRCLGARNRVGERSRSRLLELASFARSTHDVVLDPFQRIQDLLGA